MASAMELLARRPAARLLVLEQEHALAAHQSSHNSGVIHSGVYYRPGSLKARTCVEGAQRLIAFCRNRGIPHRLCGKVIVAVEAAELPMLRLLYERGRANGVPDLELLGPERLRELEPSAQGKQALRVPGAGIVDYAAVAAAYAVVIRERGGEIRTAAKVQRLLRRAGAWVLETTAGTLQAAALLTCGGLWADRLARQAGAPDDVRIIPFRGEYYELVPGRCDLVRGMIYPVPNPALPFLGVHCTRTLTGGVHVGPNAVLALARDGYRKADVRARDAIELFAYPGFWRMAWRFRRAGCAELARSFSRGLFVRALQRLVPAIRAEDLRPGASGVRAQAVDRRGALLDDFQIVELPGAICVRNVPSPAATASLSIGETIARMAAASFPLATSRVMATGASASA